LVGGKGGGEDGGGGKKGVEIIKIIKLIHFRVIVKAVYMIHVLVLRRKCVCRIQHLKWIQVAYLGLALGYEYIPSPDPQPVRALVSVSGEYVCHTLSNQRN